ncbi:signal transduction histidine kinase [Nocardia transvalensis]|uniref:histidine kinase n=1 Tax=Nocardia transvalensis TaxID=37333 RepID=A0A7W9P933_9NOCA|nr:sensor histidine kinase [Nocardia transvalensis]MBB5911739.1 signal transduction histidine kinase [Nocardia transvalensis]
MGVIDATGQTSETGPAGSVAPSRGVLGRIRARCRDLAQDPLGAIVRRVEEISFDYPPSVVAIADLAMVITAVSAAALRHAYFPSVLPFLAVALLVLCYPLFFFLDVQPRPAVFGLASLTAQGIFLMQPVSPDSSPLVLTVMVGMIAAIAPKRVSAFWALAAIVEIFVFYAVGNVDDGMPMYLSAVILGWMVGLMLQYQRRFLYQERENQEIREVRAADDERRRIAREVHDVIAHSLSVTLLHLTAARHSLETDRDVDEAVDALTDAERLGRQAMSDIRRTVGLLDTRPASTSPEPGVDDIAGLVDDFVRAGLPVDYTLIGDTTGLSPATGLALFRITQESLANVAKHASGSEVVLGIAVRADEVTVTVTNTLPGWTVFRGRGMGITGMRQRATALGGTLTAGPQQDSWHVRARIPVAAGKSAGTACPAGTDVPLRMVRDAFTSITRKPQEGM